MLELQILTLGFGMVFIALGFTMFFVVVGAIAIDYKYTNQILNLLATGCIWSLFVFVLLMIVITNPSI